MDDFVDRVRDRVVPALLTALGVMLLTGGLISYVDPTTAGPLPSQTPVEVTLEPTPSTTASPSTSPSASPGRSPSDSPSPTVSPAARAIATRIVIPAMKVDLPVIKGPPGYPPCNVAMYLKELGQPGEERASYIYAHARQGMFLPLLEASKVDNGRAMLGKHVQVYTTADQLHVYEIIAVKRHQRVLDPVFEVTEDELWMQTSEGPDASYPKLMVVARKLSVGPADRADARPRPRPEDC